MALTSLVGCSPLWVVELQEPMPEVPVLYQEWFSEVAECVGLAAEATSERFEVIRWFKGAEIRNESEGKYALGLWESPHRITIRSDLVGVDYVVKHELVHELLSDASHRSDRFQKCAGV